MQKFNKSKAHSEMTKICRYHQATCQVLLVYFEPSLQEKQLLEKIQRRYTKMINDMKGKTYIMYEDRLRCLRLWTLEKRRNRQDLIEVFKMCRGFSSISLHKLFILDKNSKGTRGHTCKLVKTRCTRDITKYFFQARSLICGIC